VVAGLGLSSKHTRTDLLHAALLGVACAARQALDALVAIQPVAAVGALRLAGGGTVLQLWRQLVAELGATTTPVATRRSGTTVRWLIFRRRSHERESTARSPSSTQARGRRSTADQRDRHLPAVELADGRKFHGKSSSLPLAAGEGEVSSQSL
jgi:hypothetical protein